MNRYVQYHQTLGVMVKIYVGYDRIKHKQLNWSVISIVCYAKEVVLINVNWDL